MHLRWLSAGLVIVVGLAAWLGFAGPARASIGVGVQANPVSLSGTAHPGASYALPFLYIVNTGTQAESMSVRVVRTTGTGLAIPESWIHIGSLNGQLPPKRSARIALELVTPAGAEPGNYVSDIVVTGSTTPEAGVNFGAAAATKLQFTITPGPAGSAFPAWTWWAIAGLVILAAAAFGWRRSGLRIRVERKKAA
jgi:uncharacterized membrane protein